MSGVSINVGWRSIRLPKEKEMYKSKINFFINLVHEIRTPLSLIRLPLEKLREEEIQREREQVYFCDRKECRLSIGNHQSVT